MEKLPETLPLWSSCAEWVFGPFQVGDFFELDFADASSKLEPQLHCDLTELVMHIPPVPTLLIPLLKGTQPEVDRGDGRITSSSPWAPEAQGNRFSAGYPVKSEFQISNK